MSTELLKARLEAELRFLKCRHDSLKALLGSEDQQTKLDDSSDDHQVLVQQLEHYRGIERDLRVILSREFVSPSVSNSTQAKQPLHTAQKPQQNRYERLLAGDDPSFKYVSKPVRGRARKALPGHPCNKCKAFFDMAGLDEKETSNLCRHKARYTPVKSPKGFWDVRLPPTPEMLARQTAPLSPEDDQKKNLVKRTIF